VGLKFKAKNVPQTKVYFFILQPVALFYIAESPVRFPNFVTLKIELYAISQHFGISASYLGRYLKKHTNETMQQYILNYKPKMVENRLLHSEMRINEIVMELGFTDESHLNKLFKKYRGCSPSDFRKRGINK